MGELEKKAKGSEDIIDAAVLVPQHKNIVFLGTATRQVGELYKKVKEGEDTIEAKARAN